MRRHPPETGLPTLCAAWAFITMACMAARGELPPFSHYSVILDRKPFGEILQPAGPVAEQPDQAAIEQAKEEQALARQIDMVAVNRTPRGKVAVGFIDKNAKPPRNYYLNVGESGGGFTVVEADFAEETATIEKDGVSIALKLGKGMVPKKDATGEGPAPSATPAATSAAPQTTAPQPPVRPPVRPGIIRRTAPPAEAGADSTAVAPAPSRGSYLETLRRRQANRAAQASQSAEELAKLRAEIAKAAQTSKEEAAKRERAINLELISRGQEPLSPIELTPEEDAELVRKGALAAPE